MVKIWRFKECKIKKHNVYFVKNKKIQFRDLAVDKVYTASKKISKCDLGKFRKLFMLDLHLLLFLNEPLIFFICEQNLKGICHRCTSESIIYHMGDLQKIYLRGKINFQFI